MLFITQNAMILQIDHCIVYSIIKFHGYLLQLKCDLSFSLQFSST